MIYLSAELTIARKPELVWSVLADVGAYASWVEGLTEVLHDTGPLFAEGASFDVTFSLAKKKVRATTEISRCREAVMLATETRIRGRLSLLDRIELAPVAEGTKLSASSELVEDAGVLRLFSRSSGLLGASEPERAPQKVYSRSFRAFKLLVEARTAAPYR